MLFTGVLAIVAMVLGAAVGVMLADLGRLRAGETAGREALAAARSFAADMLSYDYRTIEQDFARARAYTAGDLAEHYGRLATTVGPSARQQRLVQSATVAGAAVESAGPDRAEVLLFVNMSTTRTPAGEGQSRRQVTRGRVRFVMVRDDSRWLVTELSTLLGAAPPL
ncbi:hypothetical protein GCM10010156_71310 [Planobispora rosea]|uniref:Mce-associated membrane protein n=1 Tax=Planobispora rosea TaxID=35762 RepID=A0A8J3WED6_PLARO|nr:hypothetical protein GCM10010156_71310 [Planobispora rosea]GIH86869.1 hypothetical protein Pro02_52770 [Planobispora rosea]